MLSLNNFNELVGIFSEFEIFNSKENGIKVTKQ